MNYKELLEYMGIESPQEFTYFEMIADIIESEEDIALEAIYQVFRDADKSVISQLLDDYFEEITNALPDDSNSIFSLLDQIKMFLMGLIDSAETDSDYRRFADEFDRFRNWYTYDSQVEILQYDESDNYSDLQSLRDAITTSRIDKLSGKIHRYDFNKALDYEISSYAISLNSLLAAEDYGE
ncbi:MAG: hypothetical protein PHS19_02720 [Eubacteriales bacterium]|nr:hypothetical protein [Eubacteriales bacterium]